MALARVTDRNRAPAIAAPRDPTSPLPQDRPLVLCLRVTVVDCAAASSSFHAASSTLTASRSAILAQSRSTISQARRISSGMPARIAFL